MSEQPQDPQLVDNPLYLKRRARADANKPPVRSDPLGAVAAVRRAAALLAPREPAEHAAGQARDDDAQGGVAARAGAAV